MKIKTMKLKDLKAASYNPRAISKKAMKGLRASIKRFGLVDLIIMNEKTGNVISGHQRIKAAIAEGIESTQVVMVDMTGSEEKALNITLNNPQIQGTFTDELSDLLGEAFEDFGEIEFEELRLDALEETIIKKPKRRKHRVKMADDFVLDEAIKAEIDKTDNAFISFSGGKDSALMTFLTLPYLNREKTTLLFVDNGVELPCVMPYVVEFAMNYDLNLKILKPEKNFIQHYMPLGTAPNPVFKGCIELFINTPISKHIHGTAGSSILLRGGRAGQMVVDNESELQSKLIYKRDKIKFYIANPICFLSEDSFEKNLELLKKDFKLWGGYEKGFLRTACWCCPFASKNQLKALKDNYPVLWELMVGFVKDKTFDFWDNPNSQLMKAVKEFG